MSENHIWTQFVDNRPKEAYEDRIKLQCEELLSRIQLDFQAENTQTSVKRARYFAIMLIMKEMLELQNEHAPDTMEDMTVELFFRLPQMRTFRENFVRELQAVTLGKKIDDINC